MSSNKRFCLRSDTNKKRSFEWRVCDDLCADILKYLPFDDKLKLECVSKQFQRTVFKKCYKLSIDVRFVRSHKINLRAIESVLKKCPNIRQIKYNSKSIFKLYSKLEANQYFWVLLNISAADYKKLIDLIVKYCKTLVSINARLIRNANICQKLFKKFNSNEFTLKLDTDFDQRLVPYLADITKLKFKSVCAMKDENMSFLKTVKTLNLISIDLYDPDIKDLDSFIDTNNRIKHLNIFSHNLDSKDSTFAFNQISRLNDLIEFGFYNYDGFNDKVLISGLNKLATNCPHLKMIGLRIGLNADNISKADELFSPLKRFKGLKKLRLSLFNGDNDSRTEFLNKFSFKALDGLQHLTYLSLRFNTDSVNEHFLTGIDTQLPNLQYLRLEYKIKYTESSTDILSRLSKLESIYLYSDNEWFRRLLTSKLIEKCRKIQIISLKSFESIK